MEQRCVIIGASPDTDIYELKNGIRNDDFLLCADGGYVYALQAGLKPDLIIGDFDSSPLPEGTDIELIRLPVKKDDTDTMYCIKEAIGRGFREFLLVGMTGGRPDHTFANYSALLYLAKRQCKGIITDRGWHYTMVSDGSLTLADCQGFGFGVFPFGCEECQVSLSGFMYGGNDIMLTADFPLGASNTIISDRAVLCVRGSAVVMYGKR